jgi:predicted transcriptional regulator
MARTPRDVTDTELAILHVLWDQGAASRRQITDALYPGGGTTPYATVQKLLERLEAKGYVSRERGDDGLTFTAAVQRDDLIGRRLLDVAEKLCGGSVTPLLMNLVRANRLNDKELAELRDLIDDLSRASRRKGDRR